MGLGQKNSTCVGYYFGCLSQVGSAFSLSGNNSASKKAKFSILSCRIKNISLGWIKEYPSQSWVDHLFTVQILFVIFTQNSLKKSSKNSQP